MSNNIGDNDILPLEIKHIPDDIQEKYKEKLTNFHENKEKHMRELTNLLQGDGFSKNVVFEEDFLQMYLMQCKNDTTKAFYKIRNYLKLRRDYIYFYQRVENDFTVNLSSQFITPLPYRQPDGSVIILFQLGKWDPAELSFETMKQIVFIVFQQELRHPLTQLSGLHIIHDFKNTGFQHLKYCTLQNMILLNHISFNVLPIKYSGFHIINGSYLFNLLLRLSKPFLPEFFRKIIHIHSTVEELFDYFPRSTIPVTCGGTLTNYYMADWLKKANKENENFPIGGQKNVF